MAVSDKFKAKFDSHVISYRIKCYIMDVGEKSADGLSYSRSPEYTDFSDKLETDGRNLFKKVAAISHTSEGEAGKRTSFSKLSSIEFDNSNGFFDKPFPSTLKTIYGNTAVFNTTKNGKLSSIYNQKLRVTLLVTLTDGSIEEGVLGTFKIGNIERSNTDSDIKISLTDLSQKLREKDSAERVKDGLNWYRSRSIRFLLEELLREDMYDKTDPDGGIPTTFKLPDVINIPTAGTKQGLSTDNRVMSIWGRPPYYDGDVSAYLDRNMVTRSVVYVPTTSTNLTSGLYLGCDDEDQCEIWRFNRTTDKFYQVKSGITDWTLSGYFIWRMWYDSTRDQIIFVAIKKSEIEAGTNRASTAKFYKYNGKSVTCLHSGPTTISDVFMGDYCFRDGAYVTFDKGYLPIAEIAITHDIRIAGYGPTGSQVQHGENIPIPFRQYVTSTTNADTTDNTKRGIYVNGGDNKIIGRIPMENPTMYPADIDGQAYCTAMEVEYNAAADTRKVMGFRFTLGQQGFCVFNETNNCIVYVTVGGATDYNRSLVKFNVGTGTETTLNAGNYFTENSKPCDPLCGCSGGITNEPNSVFIGSVVWYDDIDTRSRTYIHKIDVSGTAAITKIYDSNSDSALINSFTPVWMAFCDASPIITSGRLKVVSFNRDALSSYDQYTLYSHPPTSINSMTTFYGKANFRHMPTALTIDSNYIMYFVSGGELYKYRCYGNTKPGSYWGVTGGYEKPIQLDSGWSAVDDEPFVACDNLAIDEETYGTNDEAIVYGISSPIPSVYYMQEAEASAKYYLWQYNKYMVGKIELADFSGMSKWDTIEALAMIADCFAGFDVYGNFVFIDDTQGTTADLIIENTGETKRLSELSIDTNEKEIYNYVKITPSFVSIEEPTAEVALSKRVDDTDSALSKGTIVLTQRDTNKKRIQLLCLTNGLVSKTSIYFKWRVFGDKFETSLRTAASSGNNYIYIRSGMDDIELGDVIIIKSELDGEEREEEFSVLQDPTDDEINIGKIILDNDLEYDHPVNSYVEINKTQSNWSNSRDNLIKDPYFEEWTSKDALGDLVNYSTTTYGYEVYTTAPNFVVFGAQSAGVAGNFNAPVGSAHGIYQVIDKEKLKPNTKYTVMVWVRTYTGSDYFDPSTFRLEVKSGNADDLGYDNTAELTGWTDMDVVSNNFFIAVRGVFTTPGDDEDTYSAEDITIGLLAVKPDNATWYASSGKGRGCIVWVDGLVVMEGVGAVPEYIIISYRDKVYPIGTTNVDIMFQAGEPEFVWRFGDIVSIDCPGMELKSQDSDTVVSLDTSSISVYGRKEFSGINNKFLNRRMASHISMRILEDYKWPHYKVDITLPLMPYLNFINTNDLLYRVDIKNKDMFHQSGGWTEQCYIQQMTHNIGSQSTTLQLRAVNSY